MVELSIEDRVNLVEAEEDDAHLLTEISKRAFEYGVEEVSRPSGYDTYKDQMRLMEYNDYHRITMDGYTVGGVVTAQRGEGRREIVRLFVDPENQRMGVGSRAVELLVSMHPEARLWTLGVPEGANGAKAFFEGLGFEQVGWTVEEGRCLWYQKTLGEAVSLHPIGGLRDGMRNVTVEGRVEEKALARMVRSRRRRETLSVTEAALVDASGRVLLTLWNEQIRQVEVGDRLRVENGYTSSYQGILQLNVGRAGTLVKLTT